MTRRKGPSEQDPQRKEKSEGLMMLTGMKEWRQQHPTATLREIEKAMDERLAKLRAGMLEELIHMSPRPIGTSKTRKVGPDVSSVGKN